jgi:hypothetical protein
MRKISGDDITLPAPPSTGAGNAASKRSICIMQKYRNILFFQEVFFYDSKNGKVHLPIL